MKDLEKYRKRKREYAKTPLEKEKRRIYMQKWRELNREKHNETARISHNKHKEKHKEKLKWVRILKVYNLTKEQYEELYKSQEGKCCICKTEEIKCAKNKLHIDHCHKTGKVRALLCSRCNGALGWYEKYLNSIEKYLTKYDKS